MPATVYSDITGNNARDSVKFMKCISAIPSDFRIKIQEEQITDYRAAVEHAQALEEISHNENNLHAYQHLHSHLNLYLQNS